MGSKFKILASLIIRISDNDKSNTSRDMSSMAALITGCFLRVKVTCCSLLNERVRLYNLLGHVLALIKILSLLVVRTLLLPVSLNILGMCGSVQLLIFMCRMRLTPSLISRFT